MTFSLYLSISQSLWSEWAEHTQLTKDLPKTENHYQNACHKTCIFCKQQIFAIYAFEQNCKIKYMQIFGIAQHQKFICIEYQHYRDVICNILGTDINVAGNKLLNKINWKIRQIKMQQIFYIKIVKLRCSKKSSFTLLTELSKFLTVARLYQYFRDNKTNGRPRVYPVSLTIRHNGKL